MNWTEELKQNLQRKNQILFSQDGAFLNNLNQKILSAGHKAAILWALEFAEESVLCLEEKYPDEDRPRKALDASRLWAAGKLKMPAAKKEILRCHALAKELDSETEIALCHAIGQACSTVHTIQHAIGYPIYELTAIVRQYGYDQCEQPLLLRRKEYLERLIFWKSNKDLITGWADFLQHDSK